MKNCFIQIWVLIYMQTLASGLPCVLRQVKYGLVCVCNNTYCDTLTFDEPKNVGDYTIISSSRAGLRFNVGYGQFQKQQKPVTIDDNTGNPKQHHKLFNQTPQAVHLLQFSQLRKRRIPNNDDVFDNALYESSDNNSMNVIFTVDANKSYQKVVGFGGAFTGAVAHNLDSLSKILQQTIYKLYYSTTTGLAFNMMRLTIGGCDFDVKQWVYNEAPANDMTLSNFVALNERDLNIIGKIKQLQQSTNNYDIRLMGAAWSSPPWMKTSNRWNGPSALQPKYFQLWADYHLRFLQLMQKQNISFWAISTGNEPMNGVFGWIAIKWLNLGWLPNTQAKYVAENLGPTLRSSPFKDVKIFAGDDQRYIFPEWFKSMQSSYPKSTDYVDGFAVHWYWDRIIPVEQLDETHRLFPNKMIMNTESCMGDNPFDGRGPHIGSWRRGELYARDMIKNFRHWLTGWIDWNLILDEEGGPNYVANYVDAPILVNTKAGDEIYKQPIYYALGHFSRFIHPNSIRIGIRSNNHDVTVVAFKRPDDKTVLVLCNERYNSVNLQINDPRRGVVKIDVPAKSIHTIVYK